MTSAPVHIAVPDGTAPYWSALLRRSGLCARPLRDGPPEGTTLFLPDDGGLACAATRRLVGRLRERGVPALVGPPWAASLGVPLPGPADLGLATHDTAGVRRLDPAPLLALPLPKAERLLRASAQSTAMRGTGGLEAREVVAEADHGGLRRCVTAALRSLAFAARRPFVHLAHVPDGHDGALAFRIDADGYRADATAALLAALARAELRATWFVDVERHERLGGLPALADLRAAGHEIQSHGYRHYTYAARARNEQNLRRSLAGLAAHGVRADAAAAPFGSWNRGWEQAVAACGLRWSSEFARVHDDVPGPLAGTADEPWQVPVHPVCPELLFAAGADADAVHAWFEAELIVCLGRAEPAVFYGHPIGDLGRCLELPLRLAAAARRRLRSLWQPTLGELHTFARARAAQEIDVAIEDGCVTGESEGPAPLVVERCQRPDERVRGTFALPFDDGPATPGPILMPAAYRSRRSGRERLRTHRLQLARLLREIRS